MTKLSLTGTILSVGALALLLSVGILAACEARPAVPDFLPCQWANDSAAIMRCENAEVLCYGIVSGQRGGLSCQFKVKQ